jgi:hypothetical protein
MNSPGRQRAGPPHPRRRRSGYAPTTARGQPPRYQDLVPLSQPAGRLQLRPKPGRAARPPALAERLGLPVIYNNAGNSAALYAHHVQFGAESGQRSSVATIVGTGLGGGTIQAGQVVKGAAGMAGELGHIHASLPRGLGYGLAAGADSACSSCASRTPGSLVCSGWWRSRGRREP